MLATDDEGRIALCEAAQGDNPEILNEVWEWGKEKLTTEEVKILLLLLLLLLTTDYTGKEFWHLAAETGNLELREKIREWFKKNLTTEEINNKFLLDTDGMGMTA